MDADCVDVGSGDGLAVFVLQEEGDFGGGVVQGVLVGEACFLGGTLGDGVEVVVAIIGGCDEAQAAAVVGEVFHVELGEGGGLAFFVDVLPGGGAEGGVGGGLQIVVAAGGVVASAGGEVAGFGDAGQVHGEGAIAAVEAGACGDFSDGGDGGEVGGGGGTAGATGAEAVSDAGAGVAVASGAGHSLQGEAEGDGGVGIILGGVSGVDVVLVRAGGEGEQEEAEEIFV